MLALMPRHLGQRCGFRNCQKDGVHECKSTSGFDGKVIAFKLCDEHFAVMSREWQKDTISTRSVK
jgi:hypothetical protein